MALRVAFFADCFHEVNGVALTSRKFAQFARDSGRPFLSVHPGPATSLTRDGNFTELELAGSRMSVGVERDTAFDLLFHRHLDRVRRATFEFGADLIHVTSPGHIGLMGAITAHRMGIPLMASWHTNIHEFAARRLRWRLAGWPAGRLDAAAKWAEDATLALTLLFYRRAKLLFAPNPELIAMLQARTGLPCHLMERGIDVDGFSPRHRTRADGDFVIGFVGRLSAEKNVRLLADLYQRLRARGINGYRFLVVGDGSERDWLRRHLPGAELPGVLRGQALAEAYANMDVFVFPSETDTFGNVIQEASASGVPCVVSAHGGPKFLVSHNETGFVANSLAAYADAVAALVHDPELHHRMRLNARRAAEGRTWAAVFEAVYARYEEWLAPQTNLLRNVSRDLHQKCNSG